MNADGNSRVNSSNILIYSRLNRYDIEVENQKKKTQEKLGPLNREFEDLDEQVMQIE